MKKFIFILIILLAFPVIANAEKILFHRATGIMYGRWSDEEWKSAPVSKEPDGTYRIRRPDWSINVHLPLELYEGLRELGPDNVDNDNEAINALRGDWGKIDEVGNPRHIIKGDKGAEYIRDGKSLDGWQEYFEETNIRLQRGR